MAANISQSPQEQSSVHLQIARDEDCTFCGKPVSEGESNRRIDKSCDRIKQASIKRGVEVIVKSGQAVHSECRRVFCNKIDIEYSLKRKHDSASGEPSKDKSLRSSEPAFSYREHCLFCGKPDKYGGRKKEYALIPVKTFAFQHTTFRACNTRSDYWSKTVKNRIEFVGDLHAADAVYHKAFQVDVKHITDPAEVNATLPREIEERLVIAGNHAGKLPDAMHYELCAYPPALLESRHALLAANKPVLANAIWNLAPLDPTDPTGDVRYVLDGGALLQRIPWQLGETYDEILNRYARYSKKYGLSIVVFDGYRDGPSTKDDTHQRRGHQARKVTFTASMALSVKKEEFLKNKENKQLFIDIGKHRRDNLPNANEHNPTLPNTSQHYPTQSNTTNHNPTQPNTAKHNPTLPNTTQHYRALLNTTQNYPTQPSTAKHYPTLPNTTKRYPTQPNATQHNQT
ncbi:hypothetical protein ScPMuIL_017206 [Solemya velum]